LGGLLAGWAALLARQVTSPRAGGFSPRPGGEVKGAPAVAPAPWGAGRRGAVGVKGLRSWWRGPVRLGGRGFALASWLVFCLLPVTAGWNGMVPWAGLVAVVMAAAGAANLYGADGTALWLTLMTPGAAAADVRGRQLAWLLVVGPAAVLIT